MFKTVNSKILFITFLIFVSLFCAISYFIYKDYKSDVIAKNRLCNLKVKYYGSLIDKSFSQVQERAIDLAVFAQHFYKYDRDNHKVSDVIIKEFFAKKKLRTGAGIWFEPYKIDRHKDRYCSYIYRQGSNVLFDKNCDSEKYNYFVRNWYKTIKRESAKNQKYVWTAPYKDQTGTYKLMTTVGSAIYDADGDFVGSSTIDLSLDSIIHGLNQLKLTPNSSYLFADPKNDYIIASNFEDIKDYSDTAKSLKTLKWYNPKLQSGQQFEYNGIKYTIFTQLLDNGMLLEIISPSVELYGELQNRIAALLILCLIACFLISATTYEILIDNMKKPISVLVEFAKKVGQGNLDEKINLNSPEEFAYLASAFNKMIVDIKNYITNLNTLSEDKKRIETELNIAQSIQYSALPNVFPPYPEEKEFDIYATMQTAKEVGGDFYDFFFIDSNHFAFLIADVSGKGIPAALFMMTSKTLIKNLAQTGMDIETLMKKVNHKIFKNNEQGFFVTAFFAVLELSTGKLSCVNAGHNPPLIKTKENKFEYVKCPSNFILGALDDMDYESCEYLLYPNDYIYLYTDGVTEAEDNDMKMFSDDRLLNSLNSIENADLGVTNILDAVKNDVENFTQGQEQSDDITMLVLKYNGVCDKDCKKFDAKIGELQNVIAWTEQKLSENNVSQADKNKICIAAEEIFVNIANYSFVNDTGLVKISCEICDNKMKLVFVDNGREFNPLNQAEPDVTLPAEERMPGGLGIFIVKQTMDSVNYSYEDAKNILTVSTKIKKETE